MSINTAATNDSTDTELPETNFDSKSLINSDILVSENQITDKQRRILLATEAFVGRSDVSFSAIARNAGVSVTYVRNTLAKYMSRQLLPVDCRTVAERCCSRKSYDNLTEMQRQIINEKVINSSMSYTEIAEVVDCSISYVRSTIILFSDIVESKRVEICN